jgi:vacuolar-type H+-ATPase subunit E/Vma4
MDEDAIARAKARLEAAAAGRSDPAEVEAALERTREGVEALAALAAELESSLPDRVENAIADGVREQVVPVGRNIAEVRGLMNQVIRRLERLEGDTLSERHARVDDLALLVDLITSGWKGVDNRLAQLEQNLQTSGGAIVYRIEEHRPDSTAETSS